MSYRTNLARKILLAGALSAPLLLYSASVARATVTITPTIVVIEGRERFADINLLNVTDKTNSYAVNWTYNRMLEGVGNYEISQKSTTEFDLTQNVFYSPKRVTIGPKGMQKVRLALRLKGEPPPPGDYRAHLQMKQIPSTDPSLQQQATPSNEKKMSVAVNVNVGFSIPVIYRVGESNVKPVIGNVTTQIGQKSGKIEAVIPVTRTEGPYGVIGQLQVFYNDKQVGLVRNANIFPEIKSRTFRVPLTAGELSGGKLRVVYKHHETGNSEIYAEKTVSIGR